MAPEVVLVQVNPANVLHVEVTVTEVENIDLINWRQLAPAPNLDFGDFPNPPANRILLLEGDPEALFRIGAVLYEGANLVGVPTLNYEPMARRRLSARGLARSGGSIRFQRPPLSVSASGKAVSGGSAGLIAHHAASAAGVAVSGGCAALEPRSTYLRVSASGTGRSGGAVDLGVRGPTPISASGTGRSGGRAALSLGSPVLVSASGQGASGGRARLRRRAPATRARRLSRAFPLQATIEHREPGPGRDEYGDHPLMVTSTEEVACNLQPQWSREQTANADTQTESLNLYLPAGVELGGQDRVVIDGVSYEVHGPGRAWVDFDQRPHHVEALLRRVA